MPRVYKPDPRGKRYKKYTKELVEQALREYSEGSNSLSNVAEKFQINKSVLYRHSIKNVKTQGGQTVCKLGVTEKRFKNNLPGPDFARSFLKRHSDKISQRVSQNIKRNRAAVSPDTIKEYFQQLQISVSDVPIENIVNYDERDLADDPGRKKIITKRGTKYPERQLSYKICKKISVEDESCVYSPHFKDLNVRISGKLTQRLRAPFETT
ncbi:unnamed protein product [Parnassius apollo]|uniref:(apollo) hypothetical protein n=1 Tax=Parnassius apollo TaxID=110799 RepID=A0A8S3WRR0_PARAO|nr:unnamed protein product [Parnassius apollo]